MKSSFLAMALLAGTVFACDRNTADPDTPDPVDPAADTTAVDSTIVDRCDSIVLMTGVFEKNMFVLADSSATRADFVSHEDSVLNVKWEIGDSIAVFNRKAVYYANSSKIVMLKYNRAFFVVDSITVDGKAIFRPSVTADMSVFDPEIDTYYACMGGLGASTPTAFLFDEDVIQSVYLSQNYVNPGTIRSNSFQVVSKAKLQADGTLAFEFHPVGCFLKVVVPDGRSVHKIRVVKSDVCPVRLSCYYQFLLNDDGTFYRGVRGNGAYVSNVNTVGGAANISYNYKNEKGAVAFFPAGTYYLPFCPDGSLKAIDVFSDSANKQYVQYATPHIVYGILGKVLDLSYLIK